jgi:hypothetical protein
MSNYRVVRKPHLGCLPSGRGKGMRAWVRWLGQSYAIPSMTNSMYVHRSGDGCISIRIEKRFLYPGESDALCRALRMLIEEWNDEQRASRAEWAALARVSRDFCGPKEVQCAVCGEKIGAYETRQYGPTGAVHVWKPRSRADRNKPSEFATDCFTKENQHLFPLHYTDG